jgi:hypothetical protein
MQWGFYWEVHLHIYLCDTYVVICHKLTIFDFIGSRSHALKLGCLGLLRNDGVGLVVDDHALSLLVMASRSVETDLHVTQHAVMCLQCHKERVFLPFPFAVHSWHVCER